MKDNDNQIPVRFFESPISSTELKDLDDLYSKECFRVAVDLIEWFEDDVGQYELRGLPRNCQAIYVPLEIKDDDDAVGEFLLNYFQAIYRIKPVLVNWNKIAEDNP